MWNKPLHEHKEAESRDFGVEYNTLSAIVQDDEQLHCQPTAARRCSFKVPLQPGSGMGTTPKKSVVTRHEC